MARHKEFDRDEALQKAMEVFWERGYEATSVRDLVGHTGVNRQSLYDTFGGKHALYLAALDRYREVEGGKMFELLAGRGSVKKALRRLFEGVVEGADEGGGRRRGCFMGNATAEMAGRCPETADRACGQLAAAEGALYRALLHGRKTGEIKNVRDPRAVARFLYSSLQGLQVMAKATPDRKVLRDIVRVTLSVLD
jgi:TetR/AcrR family transcriptional repressor of nem operon